ncbi:unnamed protein product [Microthlaspi erraticum]|uniref:Uncharacterized protein n=1 Tax=Microthlaspi erraticum TaxID=1685480 RepID=A0A6D2HUT8_9BRAS|nr:unnamed protein product [Microthlaspi erraticum]
MVLGGYFPKPYDDPVNVWEDESISFNPLENDYVAGDNASLLGFSQPSHGSLLRDGNLLRYTPIKDLSGNDSFLYTIVDINGNLAAATVHIFIFTAPPHGFSGLEISYSDLMENISVTVQALSGSVILSPMLMQFRQPASGRLSVCNGGEDGRLLILEGQIGVINPALQSIQYLGNENFAGVDSLRLSTRNKNGINQLDVPVFVEPVNDRPSIDVPQYIMLESNGDDSLIFYRETDKFNFSVGDPNLANFPGGDSLFLVTFSVEVTDGFLLANLPSELINSTELKLRNVFQWQPIQTYTAISKQGNVKASGIRFRGTMLQCNDLMQHLLHHGRENGAVLTLKLSDMRNYGCFLDYTERISLPLHAKAHVNLIRKRPLSSLAAHVLGSVIVVESLIVFSLATVLLFFTCKCAFLLVHEKRNEQKNSQKPTDNAQVLNDNVSTRTITGCLPESIWNCHPLQRQVGQTSGEHNPSPEINISP